MRIAVHDYSGHPFQIQLSRELARQGHEVLHLHFASFQTPKGVTTRRADDAPGFQIEGISLGEPFAKYRFVKRRGQEIQYGHLAARRILEFKPDVLLSGNTPLDAQNILRKAARSRGIRFVFWMQDIYSAAIDTFLKQKHFPLASLAGAWYKALEGRLLRSSDAVVAITPDFEPALEAWRVPREGIRVIENWAPLEELRPQNQDNEWSRRHGLAGRFVYMYSGTIGLKHNPAALVDLAESLAGKPEVDVVVVSEGPSAEAVREQGASRGLRNLRVLPLQPFEQMPGMLSTASVLVALLGEESGAFSVPSKVLSYLCVGRPLLLSVPSRNLAARIVSGQGAGLVVPPGDPPALAKAAARLYGDSELRERCGAQALAYARENFDIHRIAARFLEVCG